MSRGGFKGSSKEISTLQVTVLDVHDDQERLKVLLAETTGAKSEIPIFASVTWSTKKATLDFHPGHSRSVDCLQYIIQIFAKRQLLQILKYA